MDGGNDDSGRSESNESASAVLTLGGSAVAIKIQSDPEVPARATIGGRTSDRGPKESAPQDHEFYSALRPGESQRPGLDADVDSSVTHHEQQMLFDDPLAEESSDYLHELRENRHRLDKAIEWMDASQRAETEADNAVMIGPRDDTVLEFATDRRIDQQSEPSRPAVDQPRASRETRTDPRSWKSRAPFSWRRLCVSAVVSGGLGSLALMVVQWVAG